MYVAADRADPHRARARGRRRRRSRRPDRRHPGGRHQATTGRTADASGTSPSPAGCGPTSRPATATEPPAARRRRDLGPAGHRLAGRRRPGCRRGQGRAARRRRPALRRRRRRGRLGLQPRRPPARPRRRHRGLRSARSRAAVGGAAEVYVDGGVRSGSHVLLAARAGRRRACSSAGRRSTRSPRTAPTACAGALAGARRRELVESHAPGAAAADAAPTRAADRLS